MKSSRVYGDGHDEGTQERPHAGANRSTSHSTTVRIGPSSANCGMTMDSRVRSGFYAPVTQPIKRHIKVQGDANPYDPAYETYFDNAKKLTCESRFGAPVSFAFSGMNRAVSALFAISKITRTTGWRLHYCVPRTMGGSTSAENCLLLHPECHDRVHRLRLSVSKPRLPQRGVRSA